MKSAVPFTTVACNIATMDRKSIGERIAHYREAAGLNQSELARRLGVTPQSVQKWESGGAPRTRRLEQIAETLEIPVGNLVGRPSESAKTAGEWPFERFTLEDWAALSERDKGKVEGYAESLLSGTKRPETEKTA